MRKILLSFFRLFAFCASLSIPGVAQEADPAMWGTDGVVNAVCRSGNTIYLGGSFSHVGPNTGSGIILNVDGTVDSTRSPQIAGETSIVIPDGKGGWYVGGCFRAVQGKARGGVAHLLPDGSLDLAWDPVLSTASKYALPFVWTLALDGNTLYIGGSFAAVDGQPRPNIAALDATTGQLKEWQPVNSFIGAEDVVRSIAVWSSLVYVSGDLHQPGRSYKPFFKVMNAVTGEVVPWGLYWKHYDSDQILTIAVANNTVYVGGNFREAAIISGEPLMYNILALDAITGEIKAPLSYQNGPVHALAFSGNALYVGGSFTSVGGKPRNGIAVLDTTTWEVTDWSPQPSEAGVQLYTYTMAVAGNRVYASSSFTTPDGGRTEEAILALDNVTGKVVNKWELRAGGMINTIAVAENFMLVGGRFSTFGGEPRSNLAAIDATTGRPTPWNPGADRTVMAMVMRGEKVYVGGSFTSAGGAPRRHLAALDKTTGAAMEWRPEAESVVYAMALVGKTIFAGGDFPAIGGQPTQRLAALDAETGQVLEWSPGASGTVLTLAVSGSTVYAGGMFGSVGGQSRNGLAAIDPIAKRVTAWNPGADGTVRALTAAGSSIYAGGDFATVGGQSRYRLAALDPISGQVTAWYPAEGSTLIEGQVNALAADGNTLYVGGFFTNVGRANQNHLAALNIITGAVMPWNPEVINGPIDMLALHDGVVYASGRDFIGLGNKPVAGFAAFGVKTSEVNYISGSIFEDTNGNCTRDEGEKATANAVVVAQPGTLFASTDSLGNYRLAVDTGSYTISQVIPDYKADLIRLSCPVNPASHTVSFTGLGTTADGKNFANQTDFRPRLSLSVSSDRRRRCFTGVTTIAYLNAGTIAATQAKVYLKLPPHVVPISATVTYTLDKDKNLVFDVGTLAADASGSIQLIDSVVCNDPNIRGLTQCTRAWITPANTRTPGPEWDGSDITLQARCQTNGRVRLGIYNTGTGNMTDSSAYLVYLDAQLAFTRNFKLAKGDSLILQVPANGRTVRLEADQRPGHPTKQSTNVTLEACGTNAAGKVSLGFVAQLPCDDAEPEVAEECLPIIDSFDPNDKAVSPGGVTDQHYTPTRSRLDYVVRFQNTGTDVAYKVVVVDTLSADLDVSTLQVGSVSHPYAMKVSGKGRPVLTFTFNNILLPDSNANEPASHGYIQFSIKPKADLPEKTRIENFADIFFDYNEPVRTNTTFNTLYDLPPVPAENVKLDGTVVCSTTNTSVVAGSSRTVCAQDTITLAAILPAQGGGRWQRIRGTGTVTDPENPAARVTGLAYGNNVFEWRVAANTCGTDSLAGRVTITRLRQPAAPAISQRGADSLACSVAAGSYEWYFEGSPLGLRTRVIQAIQPGKYSVRVNGESGCHSEPSPAFAWLPTALETNLASLVRVYPNPTTGAFVVVLPPDLGQPVQVTLSDPVGRALAVRTLPPRARGEQVVQFDLSAGRQGVYLLKLQTVKGVVVRKVCRQ